MSENEMSNKIYVCNVNEEGRFGGPAKRIVQVAKHLIEHGVVTHVVCPKLDSRFFIEKLSQADVKYTALNLTRLSKEKKLFFRYIFRFFPEIFMLARFFRKHKFDLVHVNGSFQFKTAIAAKCARIPMIWHLNNTQAVPVIKSLFNFIAPCASGFIVAGKRVEDYYLSNNKFKNKLRLEIHAPVDVELFKPPEQSGKVPEESQEELIIATVSNVNPAKGLEYFITMASNIVLKYPQVKFLVAGAIFASQKKYTNHLMSLIADSNLNETNFVMVGPIDRVDTFLSQANICVFTSTREASPTTVWEAMSMGKPIVSTDVGSVSQYIKNGETGFVVPVKDVGELSNKLKILIDDEALRFSFAQRAREVAVKKLDISSAVDKHAAIYRDVIRM